MHVMEPRFTLEDWKLLPEGFPAQLIDGALVREPPPRYGHQRLASRIHVSLVALVGPDRAVESPIGVVLGLHDAYEPDVVVLATVPPDDAPDVGVPLLVAEVLSPSTRHYDISHKTGRYLAAGVQEVWLVDAAGGWIEVQTAEHVTRYRGCEVARSDAVPGFTLVPEALFARP